MVWSPSDGAAYYAVTAYNAYSGRSLGIIHKTRQPSIDVPGLPSSQTVRLEVQVTGRSPFPQTERTRAEAYGCSLDIAGKGCPTLMEVSGKWKSSRCGRTHRSAPPPMLLRSASRPCQKTASIPFLPLLSLKTPCSRAAHPRLRAPRAFTAVRTHACQHTKHATNNALRPVVAMCVA